MSEEIVTCPGCAKKFRLPEGAQSGAFPCTACNTSVPYGPKTKSAAKQPARPAPAQAPARPAPAQPARPVAAAAPAAPSRRAPPRRAASREAEPAKKSGNPALVWGGVAAGVAVIVITWIATRPTPAPKPAEPVAQAPKPEPKKEPVPEPKKEPAPEPKKEPAPEPVRPSPSNDPGPSVPLPKDKPAATADGIPLADPSNPAPVPLGANTSMAVLGQTVASVKGTTDEERSDLDRAVAVAMDFNAGADGSRAEGKLIKAGIKAVPPILSAFSKQYTNGKWGTDMEQWSGDKLQDLLHRITGSDCPREADFWPKFSPGSLTPPEDFEKAAKIWITWWNLSGSLKTKFKPRSGD